MAIMPSNVLYLIVPSYLDDDNLRSKSLTNEVSMSELHGVNIKVGRDLSGIVNLGEISGSVTNSINQLAPSSSPHSARNGMVK